MIGYVYHPHRRGDEDHGWAYELTALTGVEELIADRCNILIADHSYRNKEAARQAALKSADMIENAPFYQVEVG